jgi:hypothetical protein
MSIAVNSQRQILEHISSSRIKSPVLLGTCLVAVAFTAGWTTGRLRPQATGPKIAYTAGACVALEMAEAHLLIDARSKATVTEALVGPMNPYQALFPDKRSRVLEVCNDVRSHRLTFAD